VTEKPANVEQTRRSLVEILQQVEETVIVMTRIGSGTDLCAVWIITLLLVRRMMIHGSGGMMADVKRDWLQGETRTGTPVNEIEPMTMRRRTRLVTENETGGTLRRSATAVSSDLPRKENMLKMAKKKKITGTKNGRRSQLGWRLMFQVILMQGY
jgi:hypothetical protein